MNAPFVPYPHLLPTDIRDRLTKSAAERKLITSPTAKDIPRRVAKRAGLSRGAYAASERRDILRRVIHTETLSKRGYNILTTNLNRSKTS